MNKQKGLAPILIVLLIALAVGGYLIYNNYSNNRTSGSLERILTHEEVEGLIVDCKVFSTGQSHKDIQSGYLSIVLRDIDGDLSWIKVDENYKPQIQKKIEEVTSSGKCPKVIYWME